MLYIKYINNNSYKNLVPLSIIIAGLLIAGAVIYVNKEGNLGNLATVNSNVNLPSPTPTGSPTPQYKNLDGFARCLTDKGAKLYGAWWCPHCNNQKAMFGESFKYVNHIECEKNPGVSSGSMVDACIQAKIEAFPTWDFPGGKREMGKLSLETLSELSGCPLK